MVRIKFDCWVAACLGIFVIGPINHLTLVFQILLNTWILAMWNTTVLNIYILQVSARQKRRRAKMGEDIKLKYEMRGAWGVEGGHCFLSPFLLRIALQKIRYKVSQIDARRWKIGGWKN